MFSNKDLKNFIVPLFLEQLLVLTVGFADTFIVSYAGEAAVSGVSLVNSFNTVFIMLFTALASGGAVVVSQYIGREEKDNAATSISQLLMISTAFSVVMTATVLFFRDGMLRAIFGQVEPDVMKACQTYLQISAYSYPFLAVYNTGAALYRSLGRTNVTMYISIASNTINVVGNCLGVLVLKAGVAGVAVPTLIAWIFSAAVITMMSLREREIRYQWKQVFAWRWDMLKRILRIALPNAMENGVFQFVKVALSSVAAMFGTYQIAANGIAQSIWSLSALASVTMGPVFTTVVGQCMGAGDIPQAEKYFKKLLKITYCAAITWNVLILAATPLVCKGYAVSEEARHLVLWMVVIHNTCSAFVHPLAFPFGNGLRAAGDIKFTTSVTIFTSVAIRLLFSFVFAVWMNMGVIGIALAMCLDWLIRAIAFSLRFRSGKWKKFRVI